MWQVIRGDLRLVLPYIPDNSLDACVCDPPYELAFMGKRWDKSGIAFQADTWAHVLRVLKPGAHALAFGGTRTYHRMAVAIEDAGFELRDQLAWMYGQGFPKSKDAAQAIDQELGLWTPRGKRVNHHVGQEFEAPQGTEEIGPYQPRSQEAAFWVGWGSALTPSQEPIALARKPLEGTLGRNLLRWGTGCINVDACRIGTSKRVPSSLSESAPTHGWGTGAAGNPGKDPNVGRWPKNVILDEAAAAMLDAQAPNVGAKGQASGPTRKGQSISLSRNPMLGTDEQAPYYQDEGGASRFYYIAKAAKKEREGGLEHLPVQTAGALTDRKDGTLGLESPRAGAGRKGGRRNHHPTVKPISLMRWLVRLITPPGGLVIDPFTGSGSTGVAAVLEGFHFLGTDLDSDDHGNPLGYVTIAESRIRHAESNPGFFKP